MRIAKVLIVDDDEDIRAVTGLAARKVAGWDVLCAASGEQGIALARREGPDVILLDAMMPGLDGPETLARLRDDPTTARIPVIFLTARVQRHEVERYHALGAQGVIRKPFDVMELPNEVEQILESEQHDPAAGVEADLRRLQATYPEKLRRSLGVLEALLRDARNASPAGEKLDEARALAHRLKGTSGSYGLEATSSALARVEALVESLLNGDRGQSDDVWGEIEAASREARSGAV